MNSDLESLAPFIAISSAIIFGAVMWFVLTKFVGVDTAIAAGIGALLGGTEYFLLRFAFGKVIQAQNRDN